MHAESHHSALEPAAMLSDTSLEATAPLSRLIKNDRILNEILSRIGYSKTRIGVYGGAVGKTTLLKSLKVHPDIREMFQFVIWVTVPKVWKLEAVQLEIAKQLPLDDKKSISSWKLMSFLNKVKFLLILAGIHQVISLDFIGIPDPTPENGCNIVLTAVSEEICDRMEVDWKINLEGLLKEFCENAGKIDYSSDLQPLALEVVDLCGYHWHAIFLMSKALKDEYDVCVWNNAIEILRTQPAFPGRDLENIMADVLKFSYSRLPDDTTRRCLKNCALFFENQEIARDSLIDNWMSDDLTDMYSKGQKCSEDGQVFKLREIDRYLLVEHVFPSMEGVFLMRNDSRLTELPKDVNWTKLCEIYLMDNELTEFSLNHCVLLKLLPSGIGNLNCLEVFHLEGTAIVALPREVEQLTNLTSLKVSFREPVSLDHPRKMIPDGVIPQLSKLKNLYIDVSPKDERWKASVESVVLEICTLTTLDTLQFYFPNMKLLSRFNWDSIPISPPLSHFRFTIGDHTSRIICRVPREAELELVRYDKCLKYVNGEGAPKEIKKVLRHASALFLDRNMTIEKLSEFEISNMMQLKCCLAGECDKLQSILDGDQMVIGASEEVVVGFESLECLYIYYAKSLRSICEGRLDNSSFKKLKYLTLHMCPELTIVFTLELLGNLSRLEEFTVDDCSNIRRLVQCKDIENEIKHVLPALKKISLHFLPELDSISDVLSIAPRIKWMSFYYCPNLKNLPISKAFHTELGQIKSEKSWWQALEWQNTEQDSNWKDIFVGKIMLRMM
ncbi:hypothetical protein MANES_10G111380v8 [Manihot esculenta]|uniref:Uncharacterized protein n=1 Tax=Manihot esculenta TaxID=3983 RepID=A0ACB7GZY1_MANES|nr:hypothetical protein MANES_10G111380v8 [Manihot esculenta]